MDFQRLIKNLGTKREKDKQNVYEGYFGEAKPIKKSVSENIKIIKELLGSPQDLVTKEFYIGEDENQKLAVVAIDGIANIEYVIKYITDPLITELRKTDINEDIIKRENFFSIIKKYVLPITDVDSASDFKKVCELLLTGDTVLFLEGYNKCFDLDTKGWQDRGIQEPSAETVVRGARDSFNESLRTNTMLIRRRIRDINLRIELKKIGTTSRTDVSIVYIKGIANEEIVKEIHKRIDKIKIDVVLESGYIEQLILDAPKSIFLESGYIEQLILDAPKSIFPTIYNTERPDVVAADLLEGKIAIVVDNTPFVLTVPVVIIQFFQAAEDYYHRAYFGSFVRAIRYLAFFLALFTPAAYIAITTFHQEMIPTPLLVSIAAQREGTPFPAFIEALLMEVTFEILREAGIRMPRAIGNAVSIVGAIVIGEAAVNAGLVSSLMVIIVSITAISSLVLPAYSLASTVRVLRFGFIILGATFGLYGIGIGVMFLLLHLTSLRSFGVPYMYPFAPFNFGGLKDAFIRAPLTLRYKRPNLIADDDKIRQEDKFDIGPEKNKKEVKA